jgi:hypothetical protein
MQCPVCLCPLAERLLWHAAHSDPGPTILTIVRVTALKRNMLMMMIKKKKECRMKRKGRCGRARRKIKRRE